MVSLRTEIKRLQIHLCVQDAVSLVSLPHHSNSNIALFENVNSDNYVPPDVFTKRCIQKPSNELTHGFPLKHLAVSSMLFDVLMSADSVF